MSDKKDITLKPENQRFLEAWEEIKKIENFSKDTDMLKFLKHTNETAISEIRSGRNPSKKLYAILRDYYGVQDEWLRKGTGYMMVERPEEEEEEANASPEHTLYDENDPRNLPELPENEKEWESFIDHVLDNKEKREKLANALLDAMLKRLK